MQPLAKEALLAGSTMTTALDICGGTTKIVPWAN